MLKGSKKKKIILEKGVKDYQSTHRDNQMAGATMMSIRKHIQKTCSASRSLKMEGGEQKLGEVWDDTLSLGNSEFQVTEKPLIKNVL